MLEEHDARPAGDERRDPRTVLVLDFIGQPVHVARAAAEEAGLDLVGDDPDGPGIGMRTWPGVFWVTSQHPAPGAVVAHGDRVVVTFVEDGQARSDVPRRVDGPPPSLSARARPASTDGPPSSLAAEARPADEQDPRLPASDE